MTTRTTITKGCHLNGGSELYDYLITQQLPLTGLSKVQLSKRLGLSTNAVSFWGSIKRVPIARAVQVAEILGLDPIHVRNLALKEWAPELFQEDERLRQFADLTRNEAEFLEILRNSGKVNPKMNDEQKAAFEKFVSTLSEDRPTLKVAKRPRAKPKV